VNSIKYLISQLISIVFSLQHRLYSEVQYYLKYLPIQRVYMCKIYNSFESSNTGLIWTFKKQLLDVATISFISVFSVFFGKKRICTSYMYNTDP
jgi:hypothetical protein